jgi:hypothetical protein
MSNSSPEPVSGTPRQVAGHDLAAGAIDDVQPPQHVAAHQRPAQQAQQQDQPHRPGQGGAEHAGGEKALVHILGNQQHEAARHREHAAAGAARFQLAVHRALVIEFDEIVGRHHRLRPGIQVAGDPAALVVGEKIKRLPAARRPRMHRFHQAPKAQVMILLGQAGDLGGDDLVGLPVQGAHGVPVGEGQQRGHRNGEQQHIGQHDAERLGPEQVAGAHPLAPP